MELRAWFLAGIVILTCLRPHHSFAIRRKGYLTSQTGVRMEIYPDKTIRGSRNTGKFAALRISNIGRSDKTTISILGVDAGIYLCMTEKGKLYGNSSTFPISLAFEKGPRESVRALGLSLSWSDPANVNYILKTHLTKDCHFILNELPYHFMTFYRKVGAKKLYIGLTKSGKPRTGSLRNKRTHFMWKKIRRT